MIVVCHSIMSIIQGPFACSTLLTWQSSDTKKSSAPLIHFLIECNAVIDSGNWGVPFKNMVCLCLWILINMY